MLEKIKEFQLLGTAENSVLCAHGSALPSGSWTKTGGWFALRAHTDWKKTKKNYSEKSFLTVLTILINMRFFQRRRCVKEDKELPHGNPLIDLLHKKEVDLDSIAQAMVKLEATDPDLVDRKILNILKRMANGAQDEERELKKILLEKANGMKLSEAIKVLEETVQNKNIK